MKELWRYLNALNDKNDVDLAARWTGDGDDPYIEVYEEADRHVLAAGDPEEIIERVRESLPAWGLEDIE